MYPSLIFWGVVTSFALRNVKASDSTLVTNEPHHPNAGETNAAATTTQGAQVAQEVQEAQSEGPRYRWVPQDDHPCTIRRLTFDELFSEFGSRGLPPLHTEPLVIAASKYRNGRFQAKSGRDAILHHFPDDFNVTLSSSNSFSEHRRHIPLQQYIDEQVNSETVPETMSNETWYLFGETYTEEWNIFLEDYDLPPCVACEGHTVALAFGIGNRGSGVQWHVHGAGFSESVHGRKHWVMYKDRPAFHPDRTSRNWMEYNYTRLDIQDRPLECTLNPGDLVYFPDMYWHATINLDPYTAFISTFTQEHQYVDAEL